MLQATYKCKKTQWEVEWLRLSAVLVLAGTLACLVLGKVTDPSGTKVALAKVQLKNTDEAANLFNHPNYAVPGNLTVGTSGFGSVTNLQTSEGAGPRAIELTCPFNFYLVSE